MANVNVEVGSHIRMEVSIDALVRSFLFDITI